MNDFFTNIDNHINEQKKAKDAYQATKEKNEEFFELISLRLMHILEQYVQEIKKREIEVKSSTNTRHISIELKYKDGGHRSLVLNTNLNSGRIEFNQYYTNDDGKNYQSTDGGSYDESTWKDDIFKGKVEKLIQDFIFYAPRHGGL